MQTTWPTVRCGGSVACTGAEAEDIHVRFTVVSVIVMSYLGHNVGHIYNKWNKSKTFSYKILVHFDWPS